MELTANELAAIVGGTIQGNGEVKVNNFAKIEEGTEGCLTFLANPKYTQHIYTTNASAVLVKSDFVPEQEIKATLIKVQDPYATLALLMKMVNDSISRPQGIEQPSFVSEGVDVSECQYIGAFAYIGKGVKLGKGVSIYPHSYIGDNVVIGDNTTIYAGVRIYHNCVIGERCVIHAGAVIGADGFGFAPTANGYDKIPQIGIVTIEDDVEIGANTCIDRSTMGSTYVRKGVKLDNLVQIAHNTDIGANTVMSSQVGVAGSTKVGKDCIIAGMVGISGHIQIADNTTIGAFSGVSNTIKEPGQIYHGAVAIPAMKNKRSFAVYRNLPDLSKTVYELEKQIKELKEALNK